MHHEVVEVFLSPTEKNKRFKVNQSTKHECFSRKAIFQQKQIRSRADPLI